jgi:oxygen-independent coproporphyrinogen III oxidase
MAGIYIHIPYCKVACHYCNFHFSTNTAHLNDFAKALLREISVQKNYLQNEKIETLYFGGGTPSVLHSEHLKKIIDALHENFNLSDVKEWTLEANPDDITTEKTTEWKQAGVNRLSIGIQSFFDADLKWMNRVHDATQAKAILQIARNEGFDNLNVDLIYGLPEMSDEQWRQNLETFFSFDIPHLSAYCLTVEPKTALEKMIAKGRKKAVDENAALRHFEILVDMLEAHGYEHYEISNFAKPGKYAVHNSSYWKGSTYLGLGPSAHSFNGSTRQWNVSNNIQYIHSLLKENKLLFETENLTVENRFNELLMTRLRTMWGLDMKMLESNFSEKIITDFKVELNPFLEAGELILENEMLKLSHKGKFVADRIISDLMAVGND